ncbi:MAG: hypothetical protein ACRDLV_02250 [Solirubrobacteraceae bacterium]
MPLNDPDRGRSLPRRKPIAVDRHAVPEGAARRGRHRMRYDIAAVQAEMRRMSRCMSTPAVATTPDPD